MREMRTWAAALGAVVAICALLLVPARAEAQYVEPGAVAGGGATAGQAGGPGSGELPRTGSWNTEEQVAVGLAMVGVGGLVLWGIRRRQLAA